MRHNLSIAATVSAKVSLVFAFLFFLASCAMLPGGEKNLSLKGNKLTVGVHFSHEVHRMQASYRYGLYRLSRSTSAQANYLRYYNGIVRPSKVRSRETYMVDLKPVAVAQPKDGVVTFSLPRKLSGTDSCYAVVSVGSFAMPYARRGTIGESHFIDLSGYREYAAIRQQLTDLYTALAREKSDKQALLRKIESAKYVLVNSVAYKNGACALPPTGPIPARPYDAYPRYEAERIAHQAVFQYFGDRVGCHVVKGVFKKRSFKRFVDQYKCGDKTYLKYIRRGEYSDLFDLAEALLLNCSKEHQDTCLTIYGFTVLARAVTAIEDITTRLYQPYRRWQNAVERIRAEPKRLYEQCDTANNVWVNRERLTTEADNKIALGQRKHALLKAKVDAMNSASGDALVCPHDAKIFLNAFNSGLRFVSPR